ncbi:MAG TPA: hypothetical protein VMZ90_13485 [Vicinamibacterales bacterium]|nr:hypothetical protein [Vicinamibacterales bacterium]
MARCLAMSLVLAAVTAAGHGLAPAQEVPTPTLVERAGRYVAAYETAFSAIVSEEHQIQKLIRADGRARQVRDLKSDFLLVKTATGTQAFRDVIAVDGKAVRNRSDRLRKLFLDEPRTAVEQARAIAKESERHNIGLSRTGNSPLLPLMFLKPGVSSGFRFTSTGPTLAFQEVRTPSVLARRSGSTRFNLMSKGTFKVDPETGRVLAAEFTAEGPPPTWGISLAVRYNLDRNLDLMVPVEVRERYWPADKPRDDRLEVTSIYSNFRRFEVTVAQQIKAPRP